MTIAEGLNSGDLIGSQMPLHRTLDVCICFCCCCCKISLKPGRGENSVQQPGGKCLVRFQCFKVLDLVQSLVMSHEVFWRPKDHRIGCICAGLDSADLQILFHLRYRQKGFSRSEMRKIQQRGYGRILLRDTIFQHMQLFFVQENHFFCSLHVLCHLHFDLGIGRTHQGVHQWTNRPERISYDE